MVKICLRNTPTELKPEMREGDRRVVENYGGALMKLGCKVTLQNHNKGSNPENNKTI